MLWSLTNKGVLKMKARIKNQGGYTLLELIMVLLIIALLISIMFPLILGTTNDARTINGRVNSERIYGAMIDFYNDLGFWPKYVDGQKVPGGETYNILYSEQGDVPVSLDPKWLSTEKADLIENHLVANEPNYKEKKKLRDKHGWNGPYIEYPMPPDPWGNKWYINVEFLNEKINPSQKHRVWILSAGPNETIDTPYEQLQTIDQLQGDDIGLAIIH
jgi:prepilin-type N-terminal cleavage/methylation domain-containing protein